MTLMRQNHFFHIFGYPLLGWGGFHVKSPPLYFHLTHLKNIASIIMITMDMPLMPWLFIKQVNTLVLDLNYIYLALSKLLDDEHWLSSLFILICPQALLRQDQNLIITFWQVHWPDIWFLLWNEIPFKNKFSHPFLSLLED